MSMVGKLPTGKSRDAQDDISPRSNTRRANQSPPEANPVAVKGQRKKKYVCMLAAEVDEFTL